MLITGVVVVSMATAGWMGATNGGDGFDAAGPPPRPGGYFRTLPPSALLPSGEACVDLVRRSPWEPRPQNAVANRLRALTVELPPNWQGHSPEAAELLRRVDGDSSGTTDELIQWASCKWGFDDDITRAQAMVESSWLQAAEGDWESDPALCPSAWSAPCPTSFGILQIKHLYHPGTHPLSARSTAFNLDYSLALRRACYEGWSFFGEKSRGDLWACIGTHWSGTWQDPRADSYVQAVRQNYQDKTWLRGAH